MKTKLWAVGLMILCTFFTSAAQLLLKSGALKLEFTFVSVLSNWSLFLGLLSYGAGLILVLLALRGGEVTVLYPIVTSSYIWVAIWSSVLFGEVIGLARWLGIALIVLGICVITIGGQSASSEAE